MASNLSKRSRVTPTRAGMVKEVFFICWDCYGELTEEETVSHNCKP